MPTPDFPPRLLGNLCCPICRKALLVEGKSAVCPQRHSYDFARSGYLNLLLDRDRRSPEPGDSRAMVEARRAFLEAGHYEGVSRAVNDAAGRELGNAGAGKGAVVMDLGCGEGYYLQRLAREMADAACYGIDISRPAILAASRTRRSGNILWIVAGARRLPLRDASVDLALSMFAKEDFGELARVLKPEGKLVLATPGPGHLIELRRLLFERVHQVPGLDERMAHAEKLFHAAGRRDCRYRTTVDGKGVQNLVGMTPYTWKVPGIRLAGVREAKELSISVDVMVTVLARGGGPGGQPSRRPCTTRGKFI